MKSKLKPWQMSLPFAVVGTFIPTALTVVGIVLLGLTDTAFNITFAMTALSFLLVAVGYLPTVK